ncbi:hypothetical protein EXU30_11725 [Shewanella maritima]|uniref:Transporter substrate-binding domain-containing protein n=1 Tax=Shewanella maritima TaxID=2520507 RepID=A0A411PIC0_9GAMM|nr:hypothetical protein [Shewanella maritima]QBF83293.1 hypothetical protein EXU30_11725 [Shewanella maritima]
MARLLVIISILILAAKANANSQQLDIIAINYPPYIDEKLPNYGESYQLIERAFSGTQININANFLSAARALKEVNTQNWCASFHPPIPATPDHTLVITKQELVKLRLHRLLEANEFVGDELDGKVVAQLRMIAPKGVTKSFVEQGAELFLVESLPQAVSLLLKSRVDYIYGDTAAVEFAADNMNLSSALIQPSMKTYREFPVGLWFNNQCDISKNAIKILEAQGFPSKTFTKDTDKVNLKPGAQANGPFSFY